MTELERKITGPRRCQVDAARMDRVLKLWSPVAIEHDWHDVLAALDKARSALLDRMRPEDRAVAEAA